ncbi:MAG: SDR family oxidoreductase [Mobilitalea sp.]
MSLSTLNSNVGANKRVAIVTGGNSGMGKATVAALADQGYTVIMLCRNKKRGEEALQDLLKNKKRDIRMMQCDLGCLEDIRRFTEEFKGVYSNLQVLVNNAGVVSLDRRVTSDGLEEQFGVNHIGHFLLTIRLIDIMKRGSRIVVVASGAHKIGKIHFDDYNLEKGFSVIKAYSQSKLANILFARELADRIRSKGITVNCCHPGAVATSMGVDRATGFGKSITGLLKPIFLTPEEGARTAIYLATCPEGALVSGKYFYRCQISQTSKAAKSRKLAKQLFELSEQITGEVLMVK